MATPYTGDPTAVLAPAAAPSLRDYPISELPDDGDDLDVASVNQALKTPDNYIALLQWVIRNQYFGDGSDGDKINPGFIGLFGVPFYDTVSIGLAANVDTAGYPLFCRTKFTLNHASAVLRCNGGNASLATRGKYNANLTAGPHGSIAPSNGLASGSYPYTGQNHMGLGGNGGSGGGAGVSGSVIMDPGNQYKIYPWRFASNDLVVGPLGLLFAGSTNPGAGFRYDTLRGGGAGGNGEIAASSTAGAGGAGGGLVVVIAPEIELLAGTLQAVGGNGGAGAGTTGNGGGGGGGGAFLFICEKFTNAGVAVNVVKGTGGLGAGAGAPGSSGVDGNPTPFVVLLSP